MTKEFWESTNQSNAIESIYPRIHTDQNHDTKKVIGQDGLDTTG